MRMEIRLPATLSARAERLGVSALVHPHLLAFAFITVAAGLLYAPLFRPGLPPGADTPTFLHFGWFVQETLQGNGGLTDPYWYGGFPLFQVYPPLAYSLVGLLAYATPLDVVASYKVVLFVSYVSLGLATYWMALELGINQVLSAVAAFFSITAYPVFAALGVWGSFSAIASLPLSVASVAAVERGLRLRRLRWGVVGGGLLGASLLAHHMTGLAFAMALVVWAGVRFLAVREQRPALFPVAGVFVVTAGLVSLWWLAPFALRVTAIGFQREVAGLWSFPIEQYLQAIMDGGLMGVTFYPSYIGLTLLGLAIAGATFSLLTKDPAASYAAAALLLWAFALGGQSNPLIRLRPLDGLDVARFQLFWVPFAAVLGAFFLGQLWKAACSYGERGTPFRNLCRIACVVLLPLVLVVPTRDAVRASQATLRPVTFDAPASTAFTWIRNNTAANSKVLAVGWWNWDAYLIPSETGRAVMDGWHDEGARDWRPIRNVRAMMWRANVDVSRLRTVMAERNTDYVVVYDYNMLENPRAFVEALRSRPDLFREEVAEEKLSVFKVVQPPASGSAKAFHWSWASEVKDEMS